MLSMVMQKLTFLYASSDTPWKVKVFDILHPLKEFLACLTPTVNSFAYQSILPICIETGNISIFAALADITAIEERKY